MNRLIIILSLGLISYITVFTPASAQPHPTLKDGTQSLKIWQDSLKKLSERVAHGEIGPERYNANYTLIKTLVSALKSPHSFQYGFDSLKSISITQSADGRFRLFTWHVLNDDGSYRYYGTIQMNSTDDKLKLYPLIDYTPNLKHPTDTITTNDQWYGAQYYKIIPVTTDASTPYYILLGWKGNTIKTTKKIIDILYFKDNKAYFGMPIFSGGNYANKKRIIFEYTSSSTMMLNYLPEQELIVFDHLAPKDEKLVGKPEFYGPDMSYDGFKLAHGQCKFIQDIPLKNPPSDQDDQFIAPKKVIKNNRR
jgi:hypothetical protein